MISHSIKCTKLFHITLYLYHITLYHMISHYMILYYIILHIISHYTTLNCISYHILLHYITYHITFYYIILHIISHYTVIQLCIILYIVSIKSFRYINGIALHPDRYTHANNPVNPPTSGCISTRPFKVNLRQHSNSSKTSSCYTFCERHPTRS